MKKKNTKKVVWERVDKSGDCWVWQFGKTRAGYGKMRLDRQFFYAHRVAYELTYGPIPDGMFVCHSCDNPSCCNPAHLWLGTPADNMHDRDRKGRHRKGDGLRGEASPRAKLTWRKVDMIRALNKEQGLSQGDLARQFGVSNSAIGAVLRYETWVREGQVRKPRKRAAQNRRCADEYRAWQSNQAKKQWADPEIRAKMLVSRRRRQKAA